MVFKGVECLHEAAFFVAPDVVLEEVGDMAYQVEIDGHALVVGKEPSGFLRMLVYNLLGNREQVSRGAISLVFGDMESLHQLRNKEHGMDCLEKAGWLPQTPIPVVVHIEDVAVGSDGHQHHEIVGLVAAGATMRLCRMTKSVLCEHEAQLATSVAQRKGSLARLQCFC